METFYAFQPEALSLKTNLEVQPLQCYEEFILDDRKSYRCTIPDCGKIFRFKSEMMRHTVIHFDSRPYKCAHPGCKKTFKRADALDHHARTHNQVMPFECEFSGCAEKFATKAALRYHSLKHNKERPYHCPFESCGKSFLTLSQLKQHQKAFNFHSKFNATPIVEEEPAPVKIVKTCPKKENDFGTHFSIPEPRILQEMEWEIKNQDEETEEVLSKPSENITEFFFPEEIKDPILPESSENINQFFFQEDNVPEQTVESPIIQTIGSPQDLFQFMNEPSVFFNENEFKFLDFLREVDADDF